MFLKKTKEELLSRTEYGWTQRNPRACREVSINGVGWSVSTLSSRQLVAENEIDYWDEKNDASNWVVQSNSQVY